MPQSYEQSTNADPVCGMKVSSSGEAERIEYDGAFFLFCSAGCAEKFREDPARYADPAKHLDALDEKIVEVQLADYPMDNCPVGGPLGSMGDPVELVAGTRLVRFCCDSCFPKFRKNPAAYLSKLPQE